MTEEQLEFDVDDVNPAPEEQININDLADCVKIIDMCSERGAFKGNELKGVGEIRERLIKFVNAVVEANTPEEGEGEGDVTTEEGEETV